MKNIERFSILSLGIVIGYVAFALTNNPIKSIPEVVNITGMTPDNSESMAPDSQLIDTDFLKTKSANFNGVETKTSLNISGDSNETDVKSQDPLNLDSLFVDSENDSNFNLIPFMSASYEEKLSAISSLQSHATRAESYEISVNITERFYKHSGNLEVVAILNEVKCSDTLCAAAFSMESKVTEKVLIQFLDENSVFGASKKGTFLSGEHDEGHHLIYLISTKDVIGS
ncbi:hypothetical protein [Glaciecola sp. MF2-115]|uniref:hypothetical protein n=1 Tax=Glaciecola sp. MF2-115 TaxID=3384827 RepID=UPI0039A0EECD